MRILLAATVAALLGPAAALANAPAPAALPDFPPDARPGECWARAPLSELSGGPTAAPAPGQPVWTLKRGHGPEAVWRFDVRPVPGAPAMAEPRSGGPYQWVRVACQPGDIMARADAPPAPPHAMPHHSMPGAGMEHRGGMQHRGEMQHHRGMQHHEGMAHHGPMQGHGHTEAGPPPQAYAFRFERRMPPPHGFDAPPPGFDGPPPPNFQGPPPPMAFAPPPPYPEQPPRWFGDRFLTWSGKTW